jgi:hypothetical protein
MTICWRARVIKKEKIWTDNNAGLLNDDFLNIAS